jgi:Na+-driven multidrug efflux pump
MTKQTTSFKIPLRNDYEGEDNPNRDKGEENQDRGDAMVEHLSKLQEGIFSVPIKTLVWTMAVLLKESFFISFSTLGSQLVVASGYMLLNAVDDTDGMAVLGIAMSFNLIFYYGFFMSLYDKMGIEQSLTFGAKQYHLTKKVMTQSIMASTLIFCTFSVPSFLASAPLLKLAGIDSDLADKVAKALIVQIFADALEIAADMIRNFCMAQGFEAVFGPTSFLAVVTAVCSGYVMIVDHGLGVTGFILSKVIYEGVCMLVAIAALSQTHPETRGLVSLSVAKEGFWSFLCSCLIFALGSYIEFIGYEIASLFVYTTNDINQIASFTSIVNFTSIFYSIGETFAILSRTRMNVLVGRGLIKAAKNFFKFFWISLYIFCWSISAACFLGRAQISSLYANASPAAYQLFLKMLKIYCLTMSSELTMYTSFMGLKTVGRIGLLTGLNAFLLIFVHASVDFYLTKQLHYGTVEIFMVLQSLFLTLNFCCFMGVITTDWTTAKLEFEDETQPAARIKPSKNSLQIMLLQRAPASFKSTIRQIV